MPTAASPGFHGFCHGATPFSSMLMIRSVTSWRKSRGAGVTGWADLGSAVVVAIRSVPLVDIRRRKSGLWRFVLEAGTDERLAADAFQQQMNILGKIF